MQWSGWTPPAWDQYPGGLQGSLRQLHSSTCSQDLHGAKRLEHEQEGLSISNGRIHYAAFHPQNIFILSSPFHRRGRTCHRLHLLHPWYSTASCPVVPPEGQGPCCTAGQGSEASNQNNSCSRGLEQAPMVWKEKGWEVTETSALESVVGPCLFPLHSSGKDRDQPQGCHVRFWCWSSSECIRESNMRGREQQAPSGAQLWRG